VSHAINIAAVTPEAVKTAIDDWRRANLEARDAELELEFRWNEYLRGRGPKVTAEQEAHAKALRQRASSLLSRAVNQLQHASVPESYFGSPSQPSPNRPPHGA